MFCATINGDGSWTDEICSTSFNFMCYRDNQGTTEYILYTNSLKWKDAETYCKSRHSELVTIKSQAENQVVKQKANGKKIWIGLFNDPWLWADGANSTYRQWGGSDPDNANGAQGCAVLTPGMADTGCTQSWIFFCCSASTELPISKRCNLINTKKTWSEAQAYCRGMSKDLATIYTDQDRIDLLQLKNGLPDNDYPWIGIYHSKEKWQWTTGETLNYSNWAIANDCATIGADGYWHDKNCGEKAPFICSADMRNVTLVQENKTWDEALQHCRSEYTDLTSIVSKKEARLTALVAENAQSSHVWLGLRQSILGNWFWVNREPLTFQNWSLGQTPQCPRLCAAISTADHVWTPISCDQKLNFICYTDPNLE
ncbi:macrophage mannose receptor 1 [Amia ocellicauda]|uniref:macrophage mannose receptor 1 n=1 Tax=Amia ocellicauda TaxID=2972642 RepID=UPI003463D80A